MFPSISEFSFAAPGAAVSTKPAAPKSSGKPLPPGPPGAPGGKPPPPGAPGKPPARTLQIVIFFYLFCNLNLFFLFPF